MLDLQGKIFESKDPISMEWMLRAVTDLEAGRGGGGAGEEARQQHVQGHVARPHHVALAHLDVLDLRRCRNKPILNVLSNLSL